MKKDEKVVFEKYCREYDIDYRTLPLIVSHYLDIGERCVSSLTEKIIEDTYQKELKKEKTAESENKILIITADFTKYLLTACKGLYELGTPLRYRVISEVLK